ncbi:MAG: transposase [Fulvimarina manganoxydans]|nr:transposase [Fulvimarina manganoxydans]
MSKLCKELNEQGGEFQDRPLTCDLPHVWFDTTYLKVR